MATGRADLASKEALRLSRFIGTFVSWLSVAAYAGFQNILEFAYWPMACRFHSPDKAAHARPRARLDKSFCLSAALTPNEDALRVRTELKRRFGLGTARNIEGPRDADSGQR